MREESRRRLERTLLLQKLRWMAAALVVALGVGAVFWLEDRDASVETRKVAGVVEYVGPPKGNYKAVTPASSVEVDVKLDDGRMAYVLADRAMSPKLGEHVEIAEHVHGSGRHTFSWR